MGLDIYAGTLTRYYMHNWKTKLQQLAGSKGIEYNKVTPDGEDYDGGRTRDVGAIRGEVVDWMDWILKSIEHDGGGTHDPWPEDNESPYFTCKPDWDAFGALLLVTACEYYDEPVPPTVTPGWAYYDNHLVQSLSDEFYENMSLVAGVTWWLPIPIVFIMEAVKPLGMDVTIGTVRGLRAELRTINELVWQADEDTIIGWGTSECHLEGGAVLLDSNSELNTESLAKYAYSMLYQAVKFSDEHNVPIILDF